MEKILFAFLIFSIGFTVGGLVVNSIWGYHHRKWQSEGILKWMKTDAVD